MGIKDTFESLDQLVLDQYEEVNQYCHKRFGTDKYDLANYAETMAAVGITGIGLINLAVFLAGRTSGSYFINTTYTPPVTKKNPLKVMYHPLMSLIQKSRLQPQENRYSHLEPLDEERFQESPAEGKQSYMDTYFPKAYKYP